MNETVLIVIILSVTAMPCLVSYGLVRFLPRARYVPSLLLGAAGVWFIISGVSTKPTGGGISGFGDLYIVGDVIAGVIFLGACGIAFLLSFVMYKWRRSRQDG